jgi:hypothetical protein
MLFPVLAQALTAERDRLAILPLSEAFSPDGLRNLVQLLVLLPGGDDALRAGRLQLDGARLSAVHFARLNLDGVSFRSCDLSNAVFDECALARTQFEGAVLRNTAFLHVPENGLTGASFGDGEHFESILIGDRRRIEELGQFLEWLGVSTGRRGPIGGPCPTARQVLFLFRKFIHVDGQGRRDSLDRRGVLRGRQEAGAPSTAECLSASIDFGYLEPREFNQVRRGGGVRYGEMVGFVKHQQLSPGLRSLLDSLCRAAGCPHVPMSP